VALVKKTEVTAVGIRHADHTTPPLYPPKLALTSSTSGGRSVGIVSLQTKAMKLCSTYFSLHGHHQVLQLSYGRNCHASVTVAIYVLVYPIVMGGSLCFVLFCVCVCVCVRARACVVVMTVTMADE
jgi:hypothetical protein